MSGVVKTVAGIGLPVLGGVIGGPVGARIGGAIGGAIAGNNGPQQTTRTQTGIDSFVQPFRDDYLRRVQALSQQPFQAFDPNSINTFLNPFQQQVEAATAADFGRQRELLSKNVADAATRAGAFGGSRQAVLEAVGQGELGRAEAGTLANLRFSGFQDALDRALGEMAAQRAHPYQALGFFGGALSGVPQTQSVYTTTQERGNPANAALGGAVLGPAFYEWLLGRRRGIPGLPDAVTSGAF